MSMDELQRALQLIEANAHVADFEGPKPEAMVRNAELALGVTFPPTYREFLLRLGCGDIAGREFYGIIKDDFENSCVPEAVWVTLHQRHTSSLPPGLILVGATGDGKYYAIDLSTKNLAGDSPVIQWAPEEPNLTGETQLVAEAKDTSYC